MHGKLGVKGGESMEILYTSAPLIHSTYRDSVKGKGSNKAK